MKKLVLVLLFVPFALCGCAALDWFFGVKANPDGTVVRDAQSPAGSAGGIVGPVGGMVATTLGGIYYAIRSRQWANAALAAVQGVEAIKSTLTPEQKQKMVEAQEKVSEKARQLVRSVAHKIEGKV